MNSSRLALVAFLVLAGLGLMRPTAAQAHVLLSDQSGSIGAILHIAPDDDPVAGEPSSLFFDIQSQDLAPQATLRISGQQTPPRTVAATVNGNMVSASYTFPERGAYTISLAVSERDSGRSINLSHAQRVSRGATGSPLDKSSHTWAEALLIASLCAMAVLTILAINNWRQIIASSK